MDDAFRRLKAGLLQGFHAAGFLAYELGYALEPKLRSLMSARQATPLCFRLGYIEALSMKVSIHCPPAESYDLRSDIAFVAIDQHLRRWIMQWDNFTRLQHVQMGLLRMWSDPG